NVENDTEPNTEGSTTGLATTTDNDTTGDCTPQWDCTGWSDCEDGQRERECYDVNDCGTDEGKPDTTLSCGSNLDSTSSGDEDTDTGTDTTTTEDDENTSTETEDGDQQAGLSDVDGITGMVTGMASDPVTSGGIVLVGIIILFLLYRIIKFYSLPESKRKGISTFFGLGGNDEPSMSEFLDDIKNLKGIGPKTVKKISKNYDSVEELKKNVFHGKSGLNSKIEKKLKRKLK
ncbi:MAG: hypothetical protein ACOCQD_04430, partial [archaeon]